MKGSRGTISTPCPLFLPRTVCGKLALAEADARTHTSTATLTYCLLDSHNAARLGRTRQVTCAASHGSSRSPLAYRIRTTPCWMRSSRGCRRSARKFAASRQMSGSAMLTLCGRSRMATSGMLMNSQTVRATARRLAGRPSLMISRPCRAHPDTTFAFDVMAVQMRRSSHSMAMRR